MADQCKKHKDYEAKQRPIADCADCWAMWLASLWKPHKAQKERGKSFGKKT
jgi:hypothetical protein